MFALTMRLLDMLAMSLSALCLLHCLLLPVALTLLPLASAHWAESESLHASLLALALPTSATALFIGCRRHGRTGLVWLGGCGLGFLISAWWLEAYLGAAGGGIATIIGGLLLVLAHLRNFRLCREHDCSHQTCL